MQKKISHQGGKKNFFCAINLFFLHNARAAKYNSDVNGWPCLTYTDMKWNIKKNDSLGCLAELILGVHVHVVGVGLPVHTYGGAERRLASPASK